MDCLCTRVHVRDLVSPWTRCIPNAFPINEQGPARKIVMDPMVIQSSPVIIVANAVHSKYQQICGKCQQRSTEIRFNAQLGKQELFNPPMWISAHDHSFRSEGRCYCSLYNRLVAVWDNGGEGKSLDRNQVETYHPKCQC